MNRISIVTACMNRNNNLKQALKSWLEISEIHEIVIVDWNSSQNVFDDLDGEFLLEKVKIIQVANVSQWVLSLAYNLGVQHATGDIILKLDADIILDSDFFSQHIIEKGQFLRGNAHAAENDNERFLNGICMFFKTDFEKVNGYNEAIRQYGFDDDDLYNRFEAIGLNSDYIKKSFVYHIPHENRHANQDNFLPGIYLPEAHLSWIKNQANQHLTKNFYQWNSDFKKVKYNTIEEVNKVFCSPIDLDINSPNANVLEICKIWALRKVIRNVLNIPPVLVSEFSDEEIISLYKFFFPLESDEITFSFEFIKKWNAIVSSYGVRLLDFKNKFFALKKIQDEASSQIEEYQNVVKNVVKKNNVDIESHITITFEKHLLPEIKEYFNESVKNLKGIDEHISATKNTINQAVVKSQESINSAIENSTRFVTDHIENQNTKINNLISQQEQQNTLLSQQLSMINNQNEELKRVKQRLSEALQAYSELANKPVNKLFNSKAKNRFRND